MKQRSITLSRARMEVKRSLALKTTQHKLFSVPSAKELPEANQASVCPTSVQTSQRSWSRGFGFLKISLNKPEIHSPATQRTRLQYIFFRLKTLWQLPNSQQPWVFAFIIIYNKVNHSPPARERFCKAVKHAADQQSRFWSLQLYSSKLFQVHTFTYRILRFFSP